MLPIQRKLLDLCLVPKWRNWQTRVVQVHVLARVWGFESLLRHHDIPYLIESRVKTSKMSVVWRFTSVTSVTIIDRNDR